MQENSFLSACIYGIPVIVDNNMFESSYRLRQFRFPRSKKKRIRKKWGKIGKNFRMEVDVQSPRYAMIVRGGRQTWVVNSAALEAMRNGCFTF